MNDNNTDATDVYRNDPIEPFDAHLFEAAEVDDAGGAGEGEKTDSPVRALCSRTTSYGPFVDLDLDLDRDAKDALADDARSADMARHVAGPKSMCSACLESLSKRLRESLDDAEKTGAPFDPSEHTVDELKSELDGLDAAELRGLRQAEVEGKNRTTALGAIDGALDEVVDA